VSCGNPHATDCREVIEKVYIYLDGEAQHDDRQRIRTHGNPVEGLPTYRC